ncbi:protein Frey 1 [Alligator mississippiensis]|uniref:protein Frey 1 n=1 Tax=Alligator mississippiensis TaxID=8496 RepID=UPI0009076720|nr:protein Frey 1 [Alligator mississippiensis]
MSGEAVSSLVLHGLASAGLDCVEDMNLYLLLLFLLLAAVLPVPVPQRPSQSIAEDFSAPLELPQQHFGLVDDYGIKPKRLQFLTQETQAQPKGLYQARKSKRDEPDMNEYNYDANL